jgi:hypothetical protein
MILIIITMVPMNYNRCNITYMMRARVETMPGTK